VIDDVHDATPDVESIADQLIVTAWLYHPFASGLRAALAVTPGAVSSYLSEYVFTADALPA
jgi:hypothetical protein